MLKDFFRTSLYGEAGVRQMLQVGYSGFVDCTLKLLAGSSNRSDSKHPGGKLYSQKDEPGISLSWTLTVLVQLVLPEGRGMLLYTVASSGGETILKCCQD